MSNFEEQEFRDHTATFSKEGELPTLNWKKPGTGIFGVRYIIDQNILFVSGDLGFAVYRWSERITWDFLAGCDLDYFSSKCEASENGKMYIEFSQTLLIKQMEERIREYKELSEEDSFYKKSVEEMEELSWRFHTETEFEWNTFLKNNAYEMWSDDWYEAYPNGKQITGRCKLHLTGIKMAVSQKRS